MRTKFLIKVDLPKALLCTSALLPPASTDFSAGSWTLNFTPQAKIMFVVTLSETLNPRKVLENDISIPHSDSFKYRFEIPCKAAKREKWVVKVKSSCSYWIHNHRRSIKKKHSLNSFCSNRCCRRLLLEILLSYLKPGQFRFFVEPLSHGWWIL